MKRAGAWAVLLLCLQLAAWGQTIVGPDQMNLCDQATFTVTITNASATQDACALMVTHTAPNDGFLYVPGSTTITLNETAETFYDDPTGNIWDINAIRGSAYALPPGESITISYDMATTCSAVSGTDLITVDFQDCATPEIPLQNVSSTSVEILPGAITISKTPSIQDASVGDLVTWTITVENTGLGSVSNVEIVDVLDSGVAFSSASNGGSNAGQTTTWDAGTTPALGLIAEGEAVSVQLVAEVIACSGLINNVNATWGCGPSDVCYDTALDEGTATASLNLLVENPALMFDVPDITLAYCTDDTQVQIPITNSGAGAARNVTLCCSIHIYEVDATRLPAGVSYDSGCFIIPDIAPSETFNLDFYILHSDVNWCGSVPSGTNTFELTYTNDCGIPFVSYPQFSNCTSEPGPSLAVTKTGPESLRLGEIGSYDITVAYVGSVDCGGTSPGTITVVDTYPEGFTVVAPSGGIVDGGARTIAWSYDPNLDPPFAETIQLQAPTDCGYCAIPGGGTDDNTVTATGTDCCGCTITGSASAATTILCEGYGDGVALFSSTMNINRTTVVRCSSSYDVEVTHTYVFADDPALDDLLLNEFTYFVDANNDLLYETGTAAVTGATLGTVIDGTAAGRLELPLTDPISVRNKTIVYSYHLSVLGLDDASCTPSSYPINAGIELDPGATSVNYCNTMYADPAQRLSVVAQPPAMSVSIDGIPTIQEVCATYDVTITLNRTSDLAAPRDVRLILSNTGGSMIDMSQAVCGGDASPTDGTTCTTPIAGAGTYEWRFADAFVAGDTATITFPVTIPCGGSLANLSAVALFDDRCHDDAVYDDSCSTSSSDQASLSLSADVYTRKSPEIVYATTRDVSWSLVVHNTGNGTAYNVWVDDVLGSGLVFDAANTLSAGATVSANLDHNGSPINGASFLFDELAPGELKTITFAADLVACAGLTNSIAASWGCDGTNCQTPRTDSSSVVVPSGKLVATSFSPTPVPMCSDNPATVTLKNAGVTTLYNIAANVTLPAGIVYVGNPELSEDGGATWTPTAEPVIVGQLLTWTSTEIETLASMAPKDVVKIRFDYAASCGFQGGKMLSQAAYENPCATPKLSNLGSFSVGLTPAAIVTAIRQVSPAAGEAIDCGGEATWEIDVTNDGTIPIPVTQVTATLDAGLTFVTSTGMPGRLPDPIDSGNIVGQTVAWEIKALAISEKVTLSLTAASVFGPTDCDALDVFVNAAWGCGIVDGSSATYDADCTTTSPTTASISATRQPPLNLSASLSPNAIEGCDASTTLTLAVTNTSAVATTANIDTVITLPAALSYVAGSTEIDCGGGFTPASNPTSSGQTLTWYDIAAEGGASDACETIPPGGTIQLQFDVDVSCYFTTQNIPITVYYFDCCGNSQYSDSTSVSLTSLTPTLTVDKAPADTTLNCYGAGDTATWTITVENTGTGTADWIRVVDALGSSLVFDASDSPTAGAGITMGSNIIGWEIGPLAPAETFTATVTAHLAQPSNDCSLAIRRNTATVLWGCGALDGDPNTTAEASCDSGSTIQDQANVLIPNLSISPSDITPVFTCSGDGVAPSSGEIRLEVRNSGDGDITADFEITLTETTTGYSVSDRFTTLGGTLPLTAGTSQILTFAGWNVGCGSCNYTIIAAVDFLNEICECNETDNLASLPTTITLPDVVIDSASLTVTCAADGQIRIQGPVTLRNDGCGAPLTSDVLMRFHVFDGPDCTGLQIDTFTVVFSGLSLAANGGTDQQTINVMRTLAVCNVPDCQLSIRMEADDNNAICECDGTNNSLCAGNFSIASADLTVTDIDFANVTCASDTMAGFVRVTITNTGCGDSGAFDLRLATDGCLTFSDETVASVAAGGSTTVDFAVTGSWADCGDCSCTFTATIDPANAVCECDGTNNALSEPFTSTLPDLEISGAVAAIGCATDGNATVSADVTLVNTGCSDVTTDYDVRVTIYDGANCTGSVIDTWIETLSGETVLASGSNTVPLTPHVLTQALCAGDCDYSAQFEVDASNDICECDGTDNLFCLSSILSQIPNLVVTDVDPAVDCRTGTAQVAATVGNTGCGDATGVIFRLASPACGLSIDSAPTNLIAGTTQDIVFAYTPNCADWNCTYTVTADPDAAICECDGANALTFTPYPGIGSIGDTVWFDLDAAGILPDPGEDGIPGVTVIIEGDLDGDGIVDFTAETTTDANGEYLFDNLPAGDYTITVDSATLPAGMDQTYDADGLGSAHTSDYALAEDEHNREQDFGYRGSGSIGDYVWIDINGDGVQDPGEQPIENVTVTLVGDVDGDGIDEIATTTTDADGLYLFDYLPAGDYTITVDNSTLPAGLGQTYDDDGLGTAHTSDYALNAGEDNREQDFGYRGSGSIGDFVWFDINGDGVQDPGEPGFENVTVTLVGDIDLDGIDDILTTTTDANGLYLFEYLPAGDYTITVDDTTLPAGMAQTYDYDGLGTAHTSDYTLGASEHNREQDFGYATPALSVDKVITDILRSGASIGNITGPVEPGDVIVYQFIIENVGPVPAYDVGFDDTLPSGVVTETNAPGNAGTYSVSSPATSGSLALADEASTFTSTLNATMNAGATLTATFTAIVTSAVSQGTNLTNSAHAFGDREDGTPIPPENALVGDTGDADAEDPDADDTGIVTVSVLQPALSVDKTITEITRGGTSIGIAGPVQPGDIVAYQFVIENVGGATAYDVDFTDTLPSGLETEAGGTYAASGPVSSGSLAITGGQGTFTTAIGATIAGGESLTATFNALVTSSIEQGVALVNTAEASGIDGFGTEIPDANPAANDTADSDIEDPDADDTGIAIIGTEQPALSVDKIISDILRNGSSLGPIGPVEPGDVMVYQYTIRNVGLGIAYAVDFTDTLPTGLVTETNAPGNAGSYTVTAPAASGSLALPDEVGSFTTSIVATIAGGEKLVAAYTVLVTSDIEQGVNLVNVAATTGVDGAGTPIPGENAALGDTSDDDAEDADADDTGIAIVGTQQPALSVDKVISDIVRKGLSIGSVGPVEPGDVIVYQYTIRNVGLGTAYTVDFTDTLPVGLVTETDAPGNVGSYTVTDPAASGSLALADGVSAFATSITATIAGGEQLVATYTVLVTSNIQQGVDLVNTAATTATDGAGTPIPGENAALGDTSDDDPDDADADDTGIAIVGTRQPALSVDKVISDILRKGSSVGSTGPVEPGDVMTYQYTIRNVGLGFAYAVDFSDLLPDGLVTETDAPGNVGSYAVTAPTASGSLALPDEAGAFTTSIAATIAGGEQLVATYTVLVTSDIEQGVDLLNVAAATGVDGAGTAIPGENPALGDTSDDDVEDADADDTGITQVGTRQPALSVDKIITDILRRGSSVGSVGPVEPGDVVFYRYTITNVGLGTAYAVDFADTLPTGMVTETSAPGNAGSYVVTSPSASDSLALADGISSFTTSMTATIDGGETLTAEYSVLITSDIDQGVDLINVAAATGVDGAGTAIPGENATLGDTSDGDAEDPDADDVGITLLQTREPALSVDKRVTDILRGGSSIGVVTPLLYGDVIEYTVTIRNSGQGVAYGVEFTDTLPEGLETETAAPGNTGTYSVSAPSAGGSLAVPDAASTFSTSMSAILNGGATLTAVYTTIVTPTAFPSVDLINSVTASGNDGAGSPIPEENPATGDTSDDDSEDPDADDTGIAIVRVGAPALVTRKAVIAIDRLGTPISDPLVEPGDIVTYEMGIANVGTAPALNVNVVDVLPAGFLYEGNPSAIWPSGSSTTDPSGILGRTLHWTVNATLEAGEELVITFDAWVTGDIDQTSVYTNTIAATGENSVGDPIPPDNSGDVPEDDDPDDSSNAILRGALPALVTDKTILNIVRNGASLGPDSAVQAFDLITYQLLITNVGRGTAYEVNVRDTLPVPFAFEAGTTQGNWPYRIGPFTQNPAGAPGSILLWNTNATLATGETLTITFDALVNGSVNPGTNYTNVLQAEGIDGTGAPIPSNRSAEVAEDTDPDDRDNVTLVGIAEVPALVTTKRATAIIRSGDPVFDSRIEEGDIVEYALTVQNVSTVTATDVNITDQLPSAFGYIDDTSSASWPLGSSFADPSTGFNGLQWPLNATLRPGDRLAVRYLAFVMGPIYDGAAYTNTMKATGIGPDGLPIPEDQRESVPGDIDPDDASQATLIGRSAYVQGEGGSLVPVPILRKTAELLSSGVCETWNASVDRLWFQTDIAMYAAAEFELLSQVPDAASLIPESLLPTWIRTVRSETADYALDNLLQVDALSSIGIGLSHGPLIEEWANNKGISEIQALEERLSELATRAGVSNTTLPLANQWIFLEYEGGEPIYQTSRDGLLGPTGSWTITDQDIIASALGMGLVKQAMEIETLLASASAIDRYLGWVLVDVLSNKILALEAGLTIRLDGSLATIPHATQWDPESHSYTVTDRASTLFDQLSLVWGLSQTAALIKSVDNAWTEEEAGLRSRVSQSVANTLHEALLAIDVLHVTENDKWLGRTIPGEPSTGSASTLDLGLLLVAFEATRDIVTEDDLPRLDRLRRLAVEALIDRQDNDGWFSAAETANEANAWALLPQLAGIRGVLAGSDLVANALDVAQEAFDVLDSRLWVDTIGAGVYASYGTLEDRTYCYTPLEIGLATGALRELALQSADERRALILTRMSGFVRTIVDDAALQLSNASPANTSFASGSGTGTVAPISTDGFSGSLAPVLQQRLCLDDENPGDAPCSGWSVVERDPWYQTDISMFASFVVQHRVPTIEDYSDSDLNAVALHSGLGIPFSSIAALRSAVERYSLETNVSTAAQAFDPIAIPYAAGSPETTKEALAWNPGTFDTRIVASAQGMTLLREAQEARQLLDRVKKESHEHLQERLLLSSILQKLVVLQQLQLTGPSNVSYIPHAAAWNETALESWTLLDRRSTTFDQLSLLFGLSEAYALLTDPRIQSITEAQPFPTTDWGSIILGLVEDVMYTLEVAHFDAVANVLVDEANPALNEWIRGNSVSVVNLGLAASAFEHVLASFGDNSDIGQRALILLSAEVSFLQATLVDARGGFDEVWPMNPDVAPECDHQTLAGQTAALRALQAAQRWLGTDEEIVYRAFRTLDARFWDPSLFVYRTQSSLFEWCVTPLEFALTVDALSRMVDQLSGAERSQLETRIRSHIDRILDGVPLHLSGNMAFVQGTSIATDRALAPVFDARVCFQSPVLAQGANWAEPGDTIRYTVSAENITEETFYNLVLEDLLPDGVTTLATEPVGERNDPLIRWEFDDLLPSEERTWQILARINDDVPIGEVLQNCATLTYENAAGEQQPPREACADETIQSPQAGLARVLDDVEATYETDEAMHLATALEALACIPESDWQNAALAHELADENLGILLGESGLGVPLRFAPQLPTTDSRQSSLEDTLNSFALSVGLPEIPSFGPAIFLPYESGIPIVSDGFGFPATSALITPADLGWTLAREAQYAVSCTRIDDPLHRYLADWIRFTINNQLSWIATSTISSQSGSPYLPQALRATIAGAEISYGVSDTRSTVYDQASLLIGLLTAAQPGVLESRGQRLAEQLATETFEQLIRHWNPEDRAFIEPLETESPLSIVRWYDHGIAAQALSLSRTRLPRKRNTADDILEAMAETALAQGAEVQAIEEAGRLLTLLLAGDALNKDRYRITALSGWEAIVSRTYESGIDGYILSPQARRGWGHTPGQLGIVFDLLAAIASHPAEQAHALRVANDLLLTNVIADRVQLVSPTEAWNVHTQFRCSGIAPVFGQHRGILPFWFHFLP